MLISECTLMGVVAAGLPPARRGVTWFESELAAQAGWVGGTGGLPQLVVLDEHGKNTVLCGYLAILADHPLSVKSRRVPVLRDVRFVETARRSLHELAGETGERLRHANTTCVAVPCRTPG